MDRRILGDLALTVAVVSLTLSPVSGQAPSGSKQSKPAAKAWTPPHTPDGQPDLQGYWTNATYTPLERPANFADKEFFTKEEAAQFEKQRIDQFNSQAPDDIHYDNVIWQAEPYDKLLSSLRTSLIVDPPEGKIPPLTPEAQRRAAERAEARRQGGPADGVEKRTNAERCITWGNEGPPLMPVGYNANLQILQGPGYVVVRSEMIHNARLIPIEPKPHVGAGVRQWNGDSRGHWEGDTLVVDTTNFNDKINFRGSTRTLHVVERFTRVDANTIIYKFTVDDPATWTRSWSAEIPIRKTNSPIYEYACHEGNYGLANILRAARVEEKAGE
jgi:hypothetical protein